MASAKGSDYSNHTDETNAALHFTPMTMQAWVQMHQEFAETISGIEHILTDKSTHMVPLDKPELVVNAIRREVGSLTPNAKQ